MRCAAKRASSRFQAHAGWVGWDWGSSCCQRKPFDGFDRVVLDLVLVLDDLAIDLIGKQVDSIAGQRVTVEWKETDGEDRVMLLVSDDDLEQRAVS